MHSFLSVFPFIAHKANSKVLNKHFKAASTILTKYFDSDLKKGMNNPLPLPKNNKSYKVSQDLLLY